MAGAGSTFVSAGGNYLKCWDMVAAKALTTVSNHQKTITGACESRRAARPVVSLKKARVPFLWRPKPAPTRL